MPICKKSVITLEGLVCATHLDKKTALMLAQLPNPKNITAWKFDPECRVGGWNGTGKSAELWIKSDHLLWVRTLHRPQYVSWVNDMF